MIVQAQELKNGGYIDREEFAKAIHILDRNTKCKTIIRMNYSMFTEYRERGFSFGAIVKTIEHVFKIKMSESGFRQAFQKYDARAKQMEATTPLEKLQANKALEKVLARPRSASVVEPDKIVIYGTDEQGFQFELNGSLHNVNSDSMTMIENIILGKTQADAETEQHAKAVLKEARERGLWN